MLQMVNYCFNIYANTCATLKLCYGDELRQFVTRYLVTTFSTVL